MNEILEQVEIAKSLFREKILEISKAGGLTREQYIRFLSMQYHLTNGVQKTFMSIAANSVFARKRNLRKFLINFAEEEEFHHDIAKADLKELGTEPLECPLDTKIWWLYFDSLISTRPFVRLGGTCVLENISDGSADVLDKMIATSTFLNPKNLRFLIIHRHGDNLAHGEQILEALSGGQLTPAEVKDVVEGADIATTFYMRVVHWIITGKNLR